MCDAGPCRKAVDTVSDGGQVIVLDSSSYVPVNITKSVTISGEGVHADIDFDPGSGGNAVRINAPSSSIIRLRSLHLKKTGAAGGASYGIRFLEWRRSPGGELRQRRLSQRRNQFDQLRTLG